MRRPQYPEPADGELNEDDQQGEGKGLCADHGAIMILAPR
jgi:hypothetical protein